MVVRSVGRTPHLRCKKSRVISREGGTVPLGRLISVAKREQAGHRMQVSNGKTIWPMFARQTATTSRERERERERRGYLQRQEERDGDERGSGGRRALFKQSIVGGASQFSKWWISERSRGEERREEAASGGHDCEGGGGCFEICPSRDRRSFNLDKHHFRGRNTRRADGEGGRATRTDGVNERVNNTTRITERCAHDLARPV